MFNIKWPTSLRSLIISNQNETRRLLMALTAEAQALVAQVTAQKSIEAAAAAALSGLSAQITALQTQIANAGDTPEDKAALIQAVQDLQSSAAALAPAIPANTTPAAPTA
jgi:hypothetical protein